MPTPDFSLERVIYAFNNEEPFTIGNACEGVQIFGGMRSIVPRFHAYYTVIFT